MLSSSSSSLCHHTPSCDHVNLLRSFMFCACRRDRHSIMSQHWRRQRERESVGIGMIHWNYKIRNCSNEFNSIMFFQKCHFTPNKQSNINGLICALHTVAESGRHRRGISGKMVEIFSLEIFHGCGKMKMCKIELILLRCWFIVGIFRCGFSGVTDNKSFMERRERNRHQSSFDFLQWK